MKLLKKIPVLTVAFVIGLLSVSFTAYAYFSYSVEKRVASVQVADYGIKVIYVSDSGEHIEEYECAMQEVTSIAFADLGIDSSEETEVSFKLTGIGNSAAGGYGVITVGEKVYYTKHVSVGQDYSVSIKGTKDTVVQFQTCWGDLDVMDVEWIADEEETENE